MPGIAFLGGKIFTSDSKNSVVTGVYASEGRIRRVGAAEEVRKHLPQDTRVVNIEGQTLLPGLMDAHNHLIYAGGAMKQMDARYPVVGSVQELASGIANAAEETPEGEWIRGWGMDYAKYPGAQMPTRWEIDDVSSKHPVVIVHTSGHFALVNSIALEQAGLDDNVPDPKGGRFVRDEKGRLTGMLLDSAQRLVMRGSVDVGNHGPDPGQDIPVEELVDTVEFTCKAYHREGLTSIVDAQVTAREMPGYVEAHRRGLLTVKTHCMYLSNHLKDVKGLGVLGFMGRQASFGRVDQVLFGRVVNRVHGGVQEPVHQPAGLLRLHVLGPRRAEGPSGRGARAGAAHGDSRAGRHGDGPDSRGVGADPEGEPEGGPPTPHRALWIPGRVPGADVEDRAAGDITAVVPVLQRRWVPGESRG